MPISTPVTGFDPDNLQGATVRPPTAQKAAYTIDYRTPYPDSFPFRHTLVEGTNTNSGKTRENHVHRMGWNLTESGVRDDQSHATVYMSFEEHYHPASQTDPLLEWHVEGQDANGTGFRPFSFAGQYDDIEDTLSAGIQSNRITFLSTDGQSERFMLDYVNNTYALAGIGNGSFFDILGGSVVGSFSNGLYRVYPYSSSGASLGQRFVGSVFQMGEVNSGVPLSKMQFGPGAFGGYTGSLNVAKGASGQAVFGLGVDVGTSDADGDVHFLDGATIQVSGTTTGLTFGGGSDKLGFFGETPVVQQTATDLPSVLTALANLGLIS